MREVDSDAMVRIKKTETLSPGCDSDRVQVEVLWLGRWYKAVLLFEPTPTGESCYRVRLADGRERCIRNGSHIKVVQ